VSVELEERSASAARFLKTIFLDLLLAK
jgi:hypothetical protein